MVCLFIGYFVVCADEENYAYRLKGRYKTVTGVVPEVDSHERSIAIQSRIEPRIIPFSDAYRVLELTGSPPLPLFFPPTDRRTP